jgi:hypothetical protein
VGDEEGGGEGERECECEGDVQCDLKRRAEGIQHDLLDQPLSVEVEESSIAERLCEYYRMPVRVEMAELVFCALGSCSRNHPVQRGRASTFVVIEHGERDDVVPVWGTLNAHLHELPGLTDFYIMDVLCFDWVVTGLMTMTIESSFLHEHQTVALQLPDWGLIRLYCTNFNKTMACDYPIKTQNIHNVKVRQTW